MSTTRNQQALGRSEDGRLLCVCIIGTRPEVIKMAPIIQRLNESHWAKPYVIAVGQHTHLLDLAIKDFEIGIDEHIEIARPRSSLAELLARVIDGLDTRLEPINPACMIAQGDTTTVLAAGLVAFHRRIFFVHVEAGLRTGNMDAPFPEEFNRRAVTLATSLHCAPTAGAMAALIAEGVPAADCLVTGNTVIDALLETAERKPALPRNFPTTARTILLTAHRRENFGPPLERVFSTLRAEVDRYPDIGIFFPIHPNPDTRRTAQRFLGEHPRIVLSKPLGYSSLVAAMQASWLIVTDSGGLQEEAPALGKPVLVIRETTERPEALGTETVRLVGTDPDRIMQAICELHDDVQAYQRVARPVFPYGNGRAAEYIVGALRRRLVPEDKSATEHDRIGSAGSGPSKQQPNEPHKHTSTVKPRRSTLKFDACAAIAALLFPVCAFAQTVTFESTLQDRGFRDGIVLQGRATSSVFVALPREAEVTNARLIIDGQSTTPTLQRGSFSVDVNGHPVDGVSLNGKSGLVPLQRSIVLGNDRLRGFDGLNIRFEADLRASADPCTDDVDPANSVTISPQTRIAFDVDIGQVRSIADAVALLPRHPLVQLPEQPSVSAEMATAGLQLGVLLTSRGQEPRFASARGDDTVVIRLDASRSPGSPSIQIERKNNKLDIVVDPNSDFTALGLLLQAAPAALVGQQAVVSRTPAPSQSRGDNFQAFSSLPPARRVQRYGEWLLNFPLVASNGRLPDSAFLKLFIAPDWSGERPIATIYLNDQIVAAERPDIGESSISVSLPASLLRFTNALRVTLERARSDHYCAATDRGQPVQILPGSGLILGDGDGIGFNRIARAFSGGGQVALPQDAANSSSVGSYLQLASKLLAPFNPYARGIFVVFGTPSSSRAGGMLRFEAVGPGGVILPIADQIEGRNLRYEVNSPLAALSAENDGRTLLVQLTDVGNLPQPRSLYLGSGSNALIANSGVVWQNSAAAGGPSAVNMVRNIGERIFSTSGLAIGLIAISLVGLLFGSRAIVKTIFKRKRGKADR